MSVVIVVKVSEGLVLAADSAATLTGKVKQPDGEVQEGVLQTFYNAKKLMQVGQDFPIGVLTWGNAYIGSRTIESLVRQWEHENGWRTKEDFKQSQSDKYRTEACANGLLDHFSHYHVDEFGHLPLEDRPIIGFIVAGYSEDQFFPDIWRFILPLDDGIHNQRPDIEGKPSFGASWFGITEPIVRLHFGRDDNVVLVLSEKYGIPQSDLREALRPLEYQIPFAQMPLQDAIDYANYMLNVVVGRFRFVIGPELCGGEIEIAAVTQRDFNWIKRKTWKLE